MSADAQTLASDPSMHCTDDALRCLDMYRQRGLSHPSRQLFCDLGPGAPLKTICLRLAPRPHRDASKCIARGVCRTHLASFSVILAWEPL